MKYLLFLLQCTFHSYCIGQISPSPSTLQQKKSKEPLNADAFDTWPNLSLAAITNDGKHSAYVIENKLPKKRTLFVLDTKGYLKFESSISGFYHFTSDSRFAIWINQHDSLCILSLNSYKVRYVPQVAFFSINSQRVLYQSKSDSIGLRELPLNSYKEIIYANVRRAQVIINGNIKLLLTVDSITNRIQLLGRSGKTKIRELWKGENLNNLIKDDQQEQIAFLSGVSFDSLWFYKKGMKRVTYLKTTLDSNVRLTGLSNFSKNGEIIFVTLVKTSTPNQEKKCSYLSIWSYLDPKLSSQQKTESDILSYKGIVQISNGRFCRLDFDNDWLFIPSIKDTIALIRSRDIDVPGDELHWNSASRLSWYLLSFKENRKTPLEDIKDNTFVQLSPSAKYVIYFDNTLKNYFVYETGTGIRRNITIGIQENWQKKENNGYYGKYIEGWEVDDARVYINGQQDIWKIDPSGLTRPLNLTNGYGNSHNIVFSMALEEYSHRCFEKNETLILSAFNLDSKENGFYKKKTGTVGDPDSLTMGPYVYDITYNPSIPPTANYSPIKAKNTERYIVRRMSASEAPNLFVTSNFKTFKILSDLKPEKTHNWYTTELHTWKSFSGRSLQGILYKPENFDPQKKYPVIFSIYEKKSDGLNLYLEPRALEGGCSINIPYYVSNGYIIFCPDIYYTIGDPMKGTFDAVMSAVNYVSQLSFVNSKKLGIQGCSWGAIQINYLVTHTDKFAAACSASGIANWISSYCSIKGSGGSMQGIYEIGQFRVGATIWQKPDIFIKNSAILNVDKISTPLLLMHTTNDELCALSNILEFSTVLRRLKKKSWLLLYEGNHGIFDSNELDFSIHMKQFFDHYLIDSANAKWMTMDVSIITKP